MQSCEAFYSCSPNPVSRFLTYTVHITLLTSSEFPFNTFLHCGKVKKSHYFLLKFILSPCCKWCIVPCKRQISRGKIKLLCLDFLTTKQEETFSKQNVIMRQISTSCNEHLRHLTFYTMLFASSNKVKMGHLGGHFLTLI